MVATYTSSGITILLGLIYILRNYMLHRSYLENDASISIIGGADGPTAVFVASHTGWLYLEILFVFFVVITTKLFLLTRAIARIGN